MPIVYKILSKYIDFCYNVKSVTTCYREAVDSVDSPQWEKAMDDEIKSLEVIDTFSLIKLPDDKKAVGVDGFTQLKVTQTAQRSTKQGMWPRVVHKSMALILLKLSRQQQG